LSSDSGSHGRFAPGTTLASRYRIVARLGQGGMGEVYRAGDLKLGQPVALKFLPDTLESDAARLAQFHNEVRLARQIAHKNVCRMYDVGDADGLPFLTMEYVDGEDLASLLRRIGRLPEDKGLDIARQLCAGLSAAHERGVLHRDLKPANVMIDGQGQVRITDFGLAAATDTIDPTRSGTPAYMAPEQLAGKDASRQSDIYALGLVLYEVFTGRRPYQANTLAELVRQQRESPIPPPTTLVKDLNPAIERAVLRTLDPDPGLRPRSALAVAASLPGGDPLAAALAAGETLRPKWSPPPERGAGFATHTRCSRALPSRFSWRWPPSSRRSDGHSMPLHPRSLPLSSSIVRAILSSHSAIRATPPITPGAISLTKTSCDTRPITRSSYPEAARYRVGPGRFSSTSEQAPARSHRSTPRRRSALRTRRSCSRT
jgi:serine/threonine-protein kinase